MRLARRRVFPVLEASGTLLESLKDENPAIRAYAGAALAIAAPEQFFQAVYGLAGDEDLVWIYDFDSGAMLRMTVWKFVSTAGHSPSRIPSEGDPHERGPAWTKRCLRDCSLQ